MHLGGFSPRLFNVDELPKKTAVCCVTQVKSTSSLLHSSRIRSMPASQRSPIRRAFLSYSRSNLRDCRDAGSCIAGRSTAHVSESIQHGYADGYMTAWFMYHLQGDEEAGAVFFGDNAEILNNANWQDVQKNR